MTLLSSILFTPPALLPADRFQYPVWVDLPLAFDFSL